MYKSQELKNRTKQFAIRIVKLFRSLPKTEEGRILGRQMLRSGTPVAANYRAVCRSRSKAEFIAKIRAPFKEPDETILLLKYRSSNSNNNLPSQTKSFFTILSP